VHRKIPYEDRELKNCSGVRVLGLGWGWVGGKFDARDRRFEGGFLRIVVLIFDITSGGERVGYL
jgi:hypothetical protein